jgi:hypothetical protein
MGISRRTDLAARRPFKHPRRNLQSTLRIGAGDIALEHQAARPIDRRMNRDPKTRPGMKAVEQIPKLGPVGPEFLSRTLGRCRSDEATSGVEAQAFSGREIGGDDDVLNFFVGHLVDVTRRYQIGRVLHFVSELRTP